MSHHGEEAVAGLGRVVVGQRVEERELTLALGKTPVMANDSPGFVSNRILCPMINEAIFTVYEGIAEPAAVDEIMKLGMNHPIGPLALADLIGLDVVLSVMEVLHQGFADFNISVQ